MMLAMVSTCPWTKCPPKRTSPLTARSRLTCTGLEDGGRDWGNVVRRRVSGERSTVKVSLLKEVIVRQVPLTLILSPRWASVRIGLASVIVKVVVWVVSECVIEEIAIIVSRKKKGNISCLAQPWGGDRPYSRLLRRFR